MGQHGNSLTWKVASFGSNAPESERSFFFSFNAALGTLHMEEGVAIRVGNDDRGLRYILVRHRDGLGSYYSFGTGSPANIWRPGNHNNLDLSSLFGFVNHQMNGANGANSKFFAF